MIVRRKPKPAPRSEAERHFHSTPIEVTLDYNASPEAPMGRAEAEEMADWLTDLSRRGLVDDVTPHPLTDHIPVRTPSRSK